MDSQRWVAATGGWRKAAASSSQLSPTPTRANSRIGQEIRPQVHAHHQDAETDQGGRRLPGEEVRARAAVALGGDEPRRRGEQGQTDPHLEDGGAEEEAIEALRYGHARHLLPGEGGEDLATMIVARELVEGSAGRGQKDGLSGFGRGPCTQHRLVEGVRSAPPERFRPAPGRSRVHRPRSHRAERRRAQSLGRGPRNPDPWPDRRESDGEIRPDSPSRRPGSRRCWSPLSRRPNGPRRSRGRSGGDARDRRTTPRRWPRPPRRRRARWPRGRRRGC